VTGCSWLQGEYGPVDKYLYALSNAQYFGPATQGSVDPKTHKPLAFNYSTATNPADVSKAFLQGAKANVNMTKDFVALAKSFGIKTASYESGPVSHERF